MRFIVDTNVIFSGLVSDGISRKILIDSPFELYAPETMIIEIRKHERLILEKSGLSKEEFETLFGLLVENIVVANKEDYEICMGEAGNIMGHIDKNDVPFVALALSLPNDGIWTDDGDFERQSRIKIWKTEDIVGLDELGF